MTLQEITSGLGGAYKRWKTEELLKDDYKKRFFAAATEALQDEVASQVVEELVAENEEEALRSAPRKNPRYRVLSAIE
ncbi:MAG: hypothetical protein JWR61_5787 [Ferruginibacter sp.]|nr:hypothetical protein [Ferruginibacter sp.]